MPLPEYPYNQSTGKLMVQDFESMDNVRTDKMYANEIHVTDIYGTNLYGAGLPTNYGLITGVTWPTGTALTLGAGSGLMIAGRWCATSASLTASRNRATANELEYLMGFPDPVTGLGVAMGVDVPVFDPRLGYWADALGRRLIVAVPKDDSGNFLGSSAVGRGAGQIAYLAGGTLRAGAMSAGVPVSVPLQIGSAPVAFGPALVGIVVRQTSVSAAAGLMRRVTTVGAGYEWGHTVSASGQTAIMTLPVGLRNATTYTTISNIALGAGTEDHLVEIHYVY